MARVPGREPKQAPQEELSEEDAMPPAEEPDVPEDGEDVAEEDQGAALPTEDDYEEPEDSPEADDQPSEAEYDDDDRSAQYGADEEEKEEDPRDDPDWRPNLADVLADMKEPIRSDLIESKRMGGQNIDFVPWHRIQEELDFCTYGFWNCRVKDRWIDETSGEFMLTVELSIETAQGTFTRDGTGSEDIAKDNYGGPQSAAESMAFRRACARFGLALHLYDE